MPVLEGNLQKMPVTLADPVNYRLPLGSESVVLNELLGSPIQLRYSGVINCIYCQRKISKSFSQGYCYPCFKKLARCDQCIVSPEKCHYHQGTCREPEWGEAHCMRRHYVYLANSSGLKVGITRGENIPSRWIDQGAVQAVPIFSVATRYQSGLVEVALKQHVADKTNWRAMLKGNNGEVDLLARRDDLLQECKPDIESLQEQFGLEQIQYCETAETVNIHYPVLEYPTKVVAHNFDKTPRVEGTLMGIKGQYLILDTGVLNVRKFGGYQVKLEY